MAPRVIIVSRIPTTSPLMISPRKAVLAALLLGLGAALLYASIPAVRIFAEQISADPTTSAASSAISSTISSAVRSPRAERGA